MPLPEIMAAFTALFVIVDPIGLAPLFVALTRGMTPDHRRAVALRACLVALFLFTLFGLLGEAVLNFVGISMPAFRIAGGILLFLTALDMLFERRTERRQDKAAPVPDPSVFPLGTPLIAGPSGMATMVLLTTQPGIEWHGVAIVLLLMVVVVGIAYAMCLASGLLERLLGQTGIVVITRLLGMLLAALSVQFVIDGVRQAGLIPA